MSSEPTGQRTVSEVYALTLDQEIANARSAVSKGQEYTLAGIMGEAMDAKRALDLLCALRSKVKDNLRIAGLSPRRSKREKANEAPPQPES